MKKILSLIICGFLIINLAACGNGSGEDVSDDNTSSTENEASSDSGETLTFEYFALTMSVEWLQEVEAALEELGGEYDFKLLSADAGRDIETQLSQIDTAITQKIDGAFLFIVDEGSAFAAVDKFNTAGIPVIGETMRLQDSDGQNIAPYVELDAKAVGANCGDWVAENWESCGVDMSDMSTVGVVANTDTRKSSEENRKEGFLSAIEKGFPDIPQSNYFISDASTGSSEDSSENCYTNTAALIAAHPEITTWIMIGTMDSYAMGACRAVESAGLEESTILVSCGGEYAIDEWKNGEGSCWKAVCYYSAMDFAELMVEGMLEICREGTSSTDIFKEYIDEGQEYAAIKVSGNMITPDNYTEYVD